MARLRQEDGFGLIELLMAMVMLNVGILAMVAALNSGVVSLGRASHASTASALADQQMELYRGLTYGCIYLSAAGGTTNWTGDASFNTGTLVTSSQSTCGTTPPTNATSATRSIVGPDHHKYEVDTYIVLCTAGAAPCNTPAGSRDELMVSIAIHDGLNGYVWSREQSTFDQSTGG
jgi:type II secretory pathway pseudopilin PulG